MSKKTVSTFSQDSLKQIANYVKGQLPKRSDPSVMAHVGGRTTVRGRYFAKVTSSTVSGGVAYHAWTEQRWNFSSMDWEDLPDGRTGTTSVNYLVRHPKKDVAIITGTVVEVTLLEDTATGKNGYVAFNAPFKKNMVTNLVCNEDGTSTVTKQDVYIISD